jgi:hypothetical protein
MKQSKSEFEFLIHSSQIGKIVSGRIGITDEQQNTLDKYAEKENNFTPLSERQQADFDKYTQKKEAGTITEKQQELLDVLIVRRDTATALTDNQRAERDALLEKKANPELPQGAKTYAEKWFKEQLYMRRKKFTSKYTSKGNIVEDDSIKYIKEYLDLGFAVKNELFFSNTFCCGTPDVILVEEVIDAKNSYDFDTFPLFEEKIDARYFWQGQGYMILTGARKYRLVYTLMDMPEKLVRAEAAMRFKFADNIESFENNETIYKKSFDEICEEIRIQHAYSGLPDGLRIKVYEFEYEEECEMLIKQRVELVQKYIDEVLVPQIAPSVIAEIKSYSKAS